jgi:protein phosphatase
MTHLTAYGATDQGLSRAHNEDSFVICIDIASGNWSINSINEVQRSQDAVCVFAVADGMGGQNAGEVASSIAVNSIKTQFQEIGQQSLPNRESDIETTLQLIFQEAHREIVKMGKSNPNQFGMGTTLSLLVTHQSRAYVMWSGDSRVYRFVPVRTDASDTIQHQLELVTRDHSLVWEQVEQGVLTPEEARHHPNNNIITQSLGDPSTQPQPDFTSFQLVKGEKILLCSDGLNNMLSDREIEEIIREGQANDLVGVTRNLIAAANGSGGADNITVLLCDVLESELLVKDNIATGNGNKTTKKNMNKAGRSRNRLVVVAILAFILLGTAFFYEPIVSNLTEQVVEPTEPEVDSSKVEKDSIVKKKHHPKENGKKPPIPPDPPPKPKHDKYIPRILNLLERRAELYEKMEKVFRNDEWMYDSDCLEDNEFKTGINDDFDQIMIKSDRFIDGVDMSPNTDLSISEMEAILNRIEEKLDHNEERVNELRGVSIDC